MAAKDEPSRTNGTNGKVEEAPEEFQRFEELARKLTRVPKSELDKQREVVKAAPSTRRK